MFVSPNLDLKLKVENSTCFSGSKLGLFTQPFTLFYTVFYHLHQPMAPKFPSGSCGVVQHFLPASKYVLRDSSMAVKQIPAWLARYCFTAAARSGGISPQRISFF